MFVRAVFWKRPFLSSALCAAGGYALGRQQEKHAGGRALTSGFPQFCGLDDSFLTASSSNASCSPSKGLTTSQEALPQELSGIVGVPHLRVRAELIGARLGKGEALAVVQPGTLKQAVECLRACVKAKVAVIPQGKNTGLTGGSVPRSDRCDRPTVVINMNRLKAIRPIGDQMLCLAGAGIYDLSTRAAEINRESHSVLGSMFLNPSVAAGVAFGSGGTQMRKGPAYTERSVYAKVNANGRVEVVDTIGFASASTEDELLERLETSETLSPEDIRKAARAVPASNAKEYGRHICRLDKNISRWNADTSGIEPCRSEGKVMILATLHDTFPQPSGRRTLWISCSSIEEAHELKNKVLLNNPDDLPISCEYMDRDCFDVVDGAGRLLCHAISKLGIGERLSKMWALKLWVEKIPLPFFDTLPDRLMYAVNNVLPEVLPPSIQTLGKEYDHHLLVTLGEYGNGNMKRTEDRLNAFMESHPEVVACPCEDASDVGKVTFFRFAAAPAFKTWCVGNGTQGVSIDYALAKNDASCPSYDYLKGDHVPLKRMRYSHFGCNVVHEDLAFADGVDVHHCKMEIKKKIEGGGGMLPAEHGHGTEYHAPRETQERWRQVDPTNTMNPGVGGVGYNYGYKK